MKPVFNTNDPQGMVKALGDYFTGVQQVLLKAGKELPANLKADFEKIEANVNAMLRQLSDRPMDQVPAAQQAGWAMDCMARSILGLQELFSEANSMIERLMKEYGPKMAELQSLSGKVEKKELVPKAELDAAVEQARQEEREKTARISARRSELLKAELPAPAGDELLQGEDAEWSGRLAEAKERAKKLKAFGGFEKMNAERRVKLLLGQKEVFEDVLASAQELSGAEGGGAGGAGGSRMQPDPLLGAGGGAGGGGGEGGGSGAGGENRNGEKKRRFAV